MTPRLLLVRHGETVNNADGVISGQSDVPLTGLGQPQGRRAGSASGQPAGTCRRLVYALPWTYRKEDPLKRVHATGDR